MTNQINNVREISITTEQALEMYDGLWQETLMEHVQPIRQNIKECISVEEHSAIVEQSDQDMAFLKKEESNKMPANISI